ncbi:MAG: hypothetical protein J0L82_09120 [Deltaproteobacteria bacterium]|jgi:hypothetical protein|nr:hypothetical protein [Deltaproteobacteria bacterium]
MVTRIRQVLTPFMAMTVIAPSVATCVLVFSPDLFSAECEKSFVETRSKKARTLSKDNQIQAWLAATKALEKKVTEIVGKGPNGLYMPFCWQASLGLKRLLEAEYGFKTTHVEAFISSSFGDQPDTHYFLKVPDFFGKGEHLYIDPTLQQFGTNYVEPRIFVGSRAELERFIEQRGVLVGFPKFVRDYVAGKPVRQ